MSQFREYTNAFDGNGSTRILINMAKIISIWEMKNEKDEIVTCLFGEGQTWSVKESFDYVLNNTNGVNDLTLFGLNPAEELGRQV